MKVLIADDAAITRKALETSLVKWGYDVTAVKDGNEAWELLSRDDAPDIAIIDWMMPGMEGVDLCRAVRQLNNESFTYIIMCTALDKPEDLVKGFEAGVDDYIVKPCDPLELRARVKAAERVINLETFLRYKIRELEQALAEKELLQKQVAVFQEKYLVRGK